MTRFHGLAATLLWLVIGAGSAHAENDSRQLVEFPAMMQNHMMANMRDHLAALDEILHAMAAGEHDQAAAIAEARLGMSSLDAHGAHHMAGLMPQAMREDQHQSLARAVRVVPVGV